MEEKTFLNCPNCNSKVSTDADTCPNCKIEFYSCSSCGAMVLEFDNKCRSCNAILDEQTVVVEEATNKHNGIDNKSFKSLNSTTDLLTIFFSFLIIFSLISIYSRLIEISMINSFSIGNKIDFDELDKNVSQLSTIGILFKITWLLAGIIYLFWVRRAYKNLPSIQVKATLYSPAWAVGSYFVPILNLYRPFDIMKEIWNGSQPNNVQSLSENERSLEKSESSYFPMIWWIVFIIDSFLDLVVIRFLMKIDTPQKLLTGDWLAITSDIIGIFLFIIFIYLVRRINKWQTEKSNIKYKDF